MNKQEWCAARFTSELPDCLPLPELREVPGCEWAKYDISIEKDPDPEKGGRRPYRKGTEFPAEYPGFPGTF